MTRFPSPPKIVMALEKEDAAKIMAQLNAPEHKIDELFGKIVETCLDLQVLVRDVPKLASGESHHATCVADPSIGEEAAASVGG